MVVMKRLLVGVVAAVMIMTVGVSLAEVAPDYVIDKDFSVTLKNKVVSVAMIDDHRMAVVLKDKKLMVVDTASGKTVTKVDIVSDNAPNTVVVDKAGKIYVLCTSFALKTMKYRGRSYKRRVSTGLTCYVFDAAGKQLSQFDIKGAKASKSAAFVGGKLVIADDSKRALVFVNPEDGSVTKTVQGGIRLCCGIFGIAPDKDGKNVLVANLGAFKVQAYNENGATGFSFGKKGRKLEDFYGCCNPVNVSQLPDGPIITVEKDPTRIKIYNKTGTSVKSIPGVEELVKGCYYVPMTIDSKGNIYLVAKYTRIIRLKRK
jgi:DNA-binding beta-propeller fold protein YncE